jgi:hypothetical protein
MMINWRDISYLNRGDPTQGKVYVAIREAGVFSKLKPFDPILTGTYPIGIYLPESDIDIACEYDDRQVFICALQESFHHHEGFSINQKTIRGIESIIARFEFKDFLFEIFGQAIPVEEQYSYRHMIKEFELLKSGDEDFRNKIITLKKDGLSTEEAFAKLLGISGDPYLGLLEI